MNKVIEMQHINKKYYEGMENELHILHDIDLTVHDGEFVALVGESGSGKSTMMNIIGALDRPTSGQYYLAGDDISEMDDDRLSEIRNKEIGFVFQSAYMIPRISAVENVEVPLMYAGMSMKTFCLLTVASKVLRLKMPRQKFVTQSACSLTVTILLKRLARPGRFPHPPLLQWA